jgi:uncharacterized membrane protein
MLQYLIKITDSTLPSLIVISLLLHLILGGGAAQKNRYAWAGALTGLAAAAVLTALRLGTGWVVREFYDLGVMLPSIVMALIWLALLRGALLKPGPPPIIFRLTSAVLLALWLAYCLPDIFLSPPEFGVGMDNIFNTEYLFKVIGYLVALGVLLLLGWSIFKTAGQTPRSTLLIIVFLTTGVFILLQSLETAQIMVARSMLPRSRWFLGLVIFLLTHLNWFFYALMAIMSVLALRSMVRARFTPVTGANPAERRKMRAVHRRCWRYGTTILLCLGFSLLNITLLKAAAERTVEISPAEEIKPADGRLAINLNEVNDGDLHRLQYVAEDGTPVRFIIIKKNRSAYGVGLDACDICGQTGYYQRKDQVVCKLCDVVMNKSTIGFPGGCNPVPLNFVVSQGEMLIETRDLENEKYRFK